METVGEARELGTQGFDMWMPREGRVESDTETCNTVKEGERGGPDLEH